MNNIINRCILAEDTFMPGMHLREPGFKYSALWYIHENHNKNIKIQLFPTWIRAW